MPPDVRDEGHVREFLSRFPYDPPVPPVGPGWLYNFDALANDWIDGERLPTFSLDDRVPPSKQAIIADGTESLAAVAASLTGLGVSGGLFFVGDSEFTASPAGVRWQPDPSGAAWQQLQSLLIEDQLPGVPTGGQVAGPQSMRLAGLQTGILFRLGPAAFERPNFTANAAADIRNRVLADYAMFDFDDPAWTQPGAAARALVLLSQFQQAVVRGPATPGVPPISSHVPTFAILGDYDTYGALRGPDGVFEPGINGWTGATTFAAVRVRASGGIPALERAWQWARPPAGREDLIGRCELVVNMDSTDAAAAALVAAATTDGGVTVNFPGIARAWTVRSGLVVYDYGASARASAPGSPAVPATAVVGDVLGSSASKHYRHAGFSATVTDSYTLPGGGWGIEWDGEHVLSADPGGRMLRRHDGFSASIIDAIPSPGTQPTGISWDGDNLLSADRDTGSHYKHAGFTSTIQSTYFIGEDAFDLTWDGHDVLATIGGFVRKHAGFSSTILAQFSMEGASFVGVSWDGHNLLTSDIGGRHRKHDGFSSTVIDTYPAPEFPSLGITWTGRDVPALPQPGIRYWDYDGVAQSGCYVPSWAPDPLPLQQASKPLGALVDAAGRTVRTGGTFTPLRLRFENWKTGHVDQQFPTLLQLTDPGCPETRSPLGTWLTVDGHAAADTQNVGGEIEFAGTPTVSDVGSYPLLIAVQRGPGDVTGRTEISTAFAVVDPAQIIGEPLDIAGVPSLIPATDIMLAESGSWHGTVPRTNSTGRMPREWSDQDWCLGARDPVHALPITLGAPSPPATGPGAAVALVCPLPGGTLTADCAWHIAAEGLQAIDIAALEGTPLLAAAGGVLSFRGWDPGWPEGYTLRGYGIETRITLPNGWVLLYGHQTPNTLTAIGIPAVGATVAAGDVIGFVGSTGHSTGPHLHFEVRVDGVTVCPTALLPAGCP